MSDKSNDNRKYPTPRGVSATSAKRKYNAKAYDRFELSLPKGMKEKIDEVSEILGYKSRRSFILDLIKDKYKDVMGKEMIIEETNVDKERSKSDFEDLKKLLESDDIPEKYKALMIPPDDTDDDDDEDLPF